MLGHTDSSKATVLEIGGKNILDAMAGHGVERFVTLLGAGVRHEKDEVSLGGKVMGLLLKLISGDVLEDAKRYVESVCASGREWTAVRAPRLTEGEHHTGYLSLGLGNALSRADVADFMLRLATSEEYVHEMPTITS